MLPVEVRTFSEAAASTVWVGAAYILPLMNHRLDGRAGRSALELRASPGLFDLVEVEFVAVFLVNSVGILVKVDLLGCSAQHSSAILVFRDSFLLGQYTI